MGIPKFFRYISERWPTISNLVNGNIVPEFDNLYLDMNSIIHTCTHTNDGDVTARMTEKEMMVAIFNYIDHLFSVIKPKKVFYMAIDGVAPRAKMNQQRSRRFKSAKEAEENRKKAIEKGVEIPPEEPFDSNAITPGTEFMARLTVHLRYFISRKVSEDTTWQGVRVVLSGHEVPGEGEHKIMNFLRSLRSEPGYEPNTRHCLYGLDADLIMLGLSTHEPHFALLREEVVFGRQSANQSNELSEKRFFLLHLSLVREYMQIEFSDVLEEASGDTSDVFDFERILDDFILINFFIGNDFLPEIPMLLIAEGALPVIFRTYMDYLVEVKDYLTLNGVINFQNLRVWLEKLSNHQTAEFENKAKDVEWYNNELDTVSQQSKDNEFLTLTAHQKLMVKQIKPFVLSSIKNPDDKYELPAAIAPKDLAFVGLIADQTGMRLIEEKEQDGAIKTFLVVDEEKAPSTDQDKMAWLASSRRVFKIYEKANLVDQEARKQELYSAKLVKWRDGYYKRKFGVTHEAPEVKDVANNYLEGLQWVLSYYYRGCPSWSWYYHQHYAPMTSELYEYITPDFKVTFGPSVPFKPFEQLMGVLPDRSAKLVPSAYRDLMTNPASPIIDFYPHDFKTDKNGKKMEWQAVVLIPFIDEKRLVDALASRESLLTEAEKARNGRGEDIEFQFDPNQSSVYPATLEGLPDIAPCRCVVKTLNPHVMDTNKIVYGLMEGTLLGESSRAGFPTLYTLDYTEKLEYAHVRVFEMDSMNESIVLTIKNAFENEPIQELAKRLIGSQCYVDYPFLIEAKVTALSDGSSIYRANKVSSLAGSEAANINRQIDGVLRNYSRSKGVNAGKRTITVHYESLKGLVKTRDGAYRKEFGGEEQYFPVQLLVENVESEDERFKERAAIPVEEEFPLGSSAILLLNRLYGAPAVVDGFANGNINVTATPLSEFRGNYSNQISLDEKHNATYYSASVVAGKIGMSPLFFSQLTSRFLLTFGGQKFDLGVVLKKPSQDLRVNGYARKGSRGWEFSDKARDLVNSYWKKFRSTLKLLEHIQKARTGAITDIEQFLNEQEPNSAKKVLPVLQEMKTWLAEHTKSLNFTSISSEQLTDESIKKIEKWVTTDQKVPQAPKVTLLNIHRGALINSDSAHHQLRKQKFFLGNRVIYAMDYGKVPQYARGTVVGIKVVGNNTTVDVVFDDEFEAGSSLDHRLETKRGLSLDSGLLINSTFKQLAYDRSNQETFESAVSLPAVDKHAKLFSHSTHTPQQKASNQPSQRQQQSRGFAPAKAPGQKPWHAGTPNKTANSKDLPESTGNNTSSGKTDEGNLLKDLVKNSAKKQDDVKGKPKRDGKQKKGKNSNSEQKSAAPRAPGEQKRRGIIDVSGHQGKKEHRVASEGTAASNDELTNSLREQLQLSQPRTQGPPIPGSAPLPSNSTPSIAALNQPPQQLPNQPGFQYPFNGPPVPTPMVAGLPHPGMPMPPGNGHVGLVSQASSHQNIKDSKGLLSMLKPKSASAANATKE